MWWSSMQNDSNAESSQMIIMHLFCNKGPLAINSRYDALFDGRSRRVWQDHFSDYKHSFYSHGLLHLLMFCHFVLYFILI